MKKIYLVALFALTLLCVFPARADTYNFAGIYMTVEVPSDPYQIQLTPENLASNANQAAQFGETEESLRQRFSDEGILLMAYDAAQGRTLIISAVQDELGKTLYDINEQTADTRAGYRSNHANGTYCGALGYKFESCEWKNFGDNQGRFLMLKYTQKVDGKVKYRGLWRRTVRNGYTITVDLRVEGRQVSSGDISALNKIQNTISFMQIVSAPDAPLTLGFTAPPPETTNSNSFTIKGVTRPGAAVTAAYASLKNSRSKVFSATADAKGAFSIPMELPASDYYNLIVVATVNEGMESEESISASFSVEYDPTLLAVAFTSPFPEHFTGDSFKLSGTTLTGVTVQLVVNDQLSTKKTGNNRTFSFTLDTSKEGTYDIQLTFSKKDYATKVLHYVIERTMSQEEREQAVRSASASPDYSKVLKSPAVYEGRTLRYNGYIVDAREGAGEWILTFATKKTGDKFSNYLIVLSDHAVEAAPDRQVTLYGTMSGIYQTLNEDGSEASYPKVSLLLFDEVGR